MRITEEHLRAKVGIVNTMLGYDDPQFNTVGSIQLYRSNGSTAVHRVVHAAHAVESLMGAGTGAEASQFLSGMIAALRVTQAKRDRPVRPSLSELGSMERDEAAKAGGL